MAKAKKEDPAVSTKRPPLDQVQIQKVFEKPQDFLRFLQTLPPHKTIVHPEVAKDPQLDGGGYHHPLWVALSWYLRDSQGFDRYTDPDNIEGALITHILNPQDPKTEWEPQFLEAHSDWIFGLYHFLRLDCMRSVPASLLAHHVREFIEQNQE